MKIGIIVAMSKELALLLNIIENKEESVVNGIKIYHGCVGKNEVYAMQCGIGKVNAAVGTLSLIEICKPDVVINTGVAGGADRQVRRMDVVVGSEIAYHDVWCGPGNDYGCVEGLPLFYRSDPALTEIATRIADKGRILSGLICSGDKFISTVEEVADIKSHFSEALAVDMESAAIAQVCHLKGVSVFVLRIIGDTPGAEADNYSQYTDFWETAPVHTFEILSDILSQL